MEKAKISVVVPARNEEKRISYLLESLLCQTYKPLEIIVVDNASTDKTNLIAKSFIARFKQQQIALKIIFEPKIGVANARNKGFQQARGTIIASTDSDCLVSAGWLETISESFEQDKIVAVTGKNILKDANFLIKFLTQIGWYKVNFCLLKFLLGFPHFSTANGAVYKSTFKVLRGFDPKRVSPNDLDDVEFGSRLNLIGKIMFNSHMVVFTSHRRFKNIKQIYKNVKERYQSLWEISQAYKRSND